MAVTAAALQALKLGQLKNIAVRCGINSSGTKHALASRIFSEIAVTDAIAIAPADAAPRSNAATPDERRTPGRGAGSTRVLSIDMGIRNLAYCVFDAPPFPRPRGIRASSPAMPSLIAWKRLAVSPRPDASRLESARETFEPQTFASLAYLLLVDTLLSYGPTLVLIERQRYRSAGSSAVQEWTVRVNMFEGMLYAVLHTLHAEGRWKGTVRGVTPGKVGGFWVGGTATSTAKSAKWRNKTAKIDLVGSWLEAGGNGVLALGTDEASQTASAFLERWKGRGKRRSASKTSDTVTAAEGADERPSKLDDLADCLLQGLAWIRWEENKLRIRAKGAAALEEDAE
ncbi:hypothetical protein GP486_007759 [Trichoglossum hirsutum]|uniref:Mitochondrial resolvase Ydc2 catalytic domain-containing protein n=1 Tax=Trichoglossum hirsutum TaxID=265104 RepID=A0A9P8IH25_9PEZI|nr:hypothetical protein GP486_007759 [Trichoglossum hirsutum]